MKIALCLSGQPRNAIATSNRIKHTILDDNDVDVFLHSWYDSNDLNFHKRCPGHWNKVADSDIDKQLIDIYKPKAYIFEKPKYWENHKMKVSIENIKKCYDYGLNDPEGIHKFEKYIVNTCHSQWYSNSRVNFLKEEYSINNNIKYDSVIKLRYDVSPSIKLKFNNVLMDDNMIYYQNTNQPLNMVNDWFAMGSNKVMNIWSNLYFFIEQLYSQVVSEETIWCSELLLRNHLKNNLIKTQAIDFGVSF
jgi:hypothetical protein